MQKFIDVRTSHVRDLVATGMIWFRPDRTMLWLATDFKISCFFCDAVSLIKSTKFFKYKSESAIFFDFDNVKIRY